MRVGDIAEESWEEGYMSHVVSWKARPQAWMGSDQKRHHSARDVCGKHFCGEDIHGEGVREEDVCGEGICELSHWVDR